MDESNKTFCMAPWVHLDVRPNGDVCPCCYFQFEDHIEPYSIETMISDWSNNYPTSNCLGSLMEDSSIKNFWNNDKMKQLRKNMLEGKKSDFCSACYKEEELGYRSLRMDFNQNHSKHYKYVKETKEDGTFERFNLISWKFEVSNVCNFKCRTCAPDCSTSWGQEIKNKFDVKGELPEINVTEIYKDIEPLYDIVEEVYFAGGEPLITDYHYHILNKLIEKNKTNISIFYNTNFSTFTYKGINVFDLWDKFENLNIVISMDGFGKRGELIRKGFNWQNFLDNFKIFRTRFPYPQHNIEINCVFQVMNCFHVMDLQKELYDKKIIEDLDQFKITILFAPNILCISILDLKTKQNLSKKIKDHIKNYLLPKKAYFSINQYLSILKFLNMHKKDYLIPYFKKYMSEIDNMRNENYLEVFPELQEIFGDLDNSFLL